MKRLALLSILILAAAALAGCTGSSTSDVDDDQNDGDDPDAQNDGDNGDNGDNGDSSTATPTDDSQGNETDNGTVEANQPPTASIDADTTSGAAPLQVNFSLSGSDPDGDAIAWVFDADGDGEADAEGEELPADVAFTFEEAGNYTASLTVTDGDESASDSLPVTVGSGGGEEPAGQVASGSWTVGAANCPHNVVGVYEPLDASAFGPPGDGVSWGFFEVDPSTYGMTWSLESTDGSVAPLIIELDFFDVDGSFMEYHAGGPGEVLTGAVPGGAGYAMVLPCGDGGGDYTYTAS